ncbi:MAG: ATP-binding protein [Vicinamibacteria bacterium]
MRRPSLRTTAGLAVLLVGIVEVQGIATTLAGQGRLRERVVRVVRGAIAAAWPRLAARVEPGTPAAFRDAIQDAIASGLASEIEVFSFDGSLVQREPSLAAPVEHWPQPADLEAARKGGVVSAGPFFGQATRALTYVAFPSGRGLVLLRFATPVPELVEDLRDRQPLFLAHALALGLVLLAGALALFPAGEPAPAAGEHALSAYETAMSRLQARSREREADLRRVEDELREKAALARSGELAAGIAHEVRNSLGTIVGYARLAEHAQAEGERLDAARGIRQECETLDSVVRRFVDFVKDEALERRSFEIELLLRRVVARETRSRPGSNVTLAGAQVSFDGDEELLERAFENLVRNALEAAGPEGRVRAGAEDLGAAVMVRIEDDGPGLPEDLRRAPRLFYTTKPRGLGLGLPMAAKIVQLHGGELRFEDASPRGLAVVVVLPRAHAASANVTERNGSAPPRAGSGDDALPTSDSNQ